MQGIVTVWFALSVLVEVVGNVALYLWLRRRQVRMIIGLAGLHGYLDLLYARWCREHGRSAARVLWLRRGSLANMVAAAIVFISDVASR